MLTDNHSLYTSSGRYSKERKIRLSCGLGILASVALQRVCPPNRVKYLEHSLRHGPKLVLDIVTVNLTQKMLEKNPLTPRS